MKKSELMDMVGMNVKVILFDGATLEGVLEYDERFDEHFRKPGYFYIGTMGFKVSHVKKSEVI